MKNIQCSALTANDYGPTLTKSSLLALQECRVLDLRATIPRLRERHQLREHLLVERVGAAEKSVQLVNSFVSGTHRHAVALNLAAHQVNGARNEVQGAPDRHSGPRVLCRYQYPFGVSCR